MMNRQMAQPLRVLVLEDRATDAELVIRELRQAGFECDWTRVETPAAFVDALDPAPDVVLADFSLPGWNSAEALRQMRARDLDIPFIVTSGTIGEDAAVAMMREGADDYLLKDRLTRLGPAVRQALERRRLREERRALEAELRTTEARFRTLIEKSWDLFMLFGLDGKVVYASPSTPKVLGYTGQDFLGRPAAEFVHPDDRSALAAALARSVEMPAVSLIAAARVRHQDGSHLDFEWTLTNLLHEPAVGAIVVNCRDITERRHAERVLTAAREQLQRAVAAGQVGLWDWDLGTGRVYYSSEWKRQIGYRDDELADTPDEWRSRLHPEDRDRAEAAVQAYLAGTAASYEVEFRFRHKNGSYRNILSRATKLLGDDGTPLRLSGSHVDITERVQLEAQFRQAQKMEIVGRLAGGIAHDFNNIITIINGTADLALEGMRPEDPLRSDLEEIARAGTRAASLARQLLAFSRKQVMVPRVVNLNAVISEMVPMLRRLIGEDVELVVGLSDTLCHVRVDPAQIEQVILNLAVNARDAMPNGGRLTIETRLVPAEVELSQRGVLLTVRDTGVGMDEATRAHVFEPFFTTKETGKGTGLGLATVHGIVVQSGGRVEVRSELGVGSAFEIALPVVDAPLTDTGPPPCGATKAGSETILLVEDEPSIRFLTARVLKLAGYDVIAAEDGEAAVRALLGAGRPVQLLLTDVVLPGMNGRAIARRVSEIQPAIRVLYMSGYLPDPTLADTGNGHFIGKPFVAEELKRKVREVLNR